MVGFKAKKGDEKLIECVHNNPALYDLGHKDYKNQYKKVEIWNSIAKATGMDSKICDKTFLFKL